MSLPQGLAHPRKLCGTGSAADADLPGCSSAETRMLPAAPFAEGRSFILYRRTIAVRAASLGRDLQLHARTLKVFPLLKSGYKGP
jgi:hypothetical protein